MLVSEIMLQQTQAARVIPIFEAFMQRFPTVSALAAATRADVLRAWAGLGYNRRAIALHAAASTIVREHGSRIPQDPATLRSLPGVGEYTAAAVASLAFGRPVAAVDTNVRRIWARVVHAAEPDELAMGTSRSDAQAWLDTADPGAWNQALMDLGREVCRPLPRCERCPLRPWCRFASAGRKGRASAPRQPPFAGSLRQVRGAVVTFLRATPSPTLAATSRATGHTLERVTEAVAGLVRDGVVDASPAALRGSGRGRIRLNGDGRGATRP